MGVQTGVAAAGEEEEETGAAEVGAEEENGGETTIEEIGDDGGIDDEATEDEGVEEETTEDVGGSGIKLEGATLALSDALNVADARARIAPIVDGL